MRKIQKLENEIGKIKARNRRVEADKEWETSFARKVIIFVLTYATIVIFFFAAGLPDPFANSLVPALAFFLSTLTLPWFKQKWLEKRKG